MNRKAGVGETQNTTQTGYRVKSGLRSLFISFISLTKYNLEKSSHTSIGNSHSLKLGFFASNLLQRKRRVRSEMCELCILKTLCPWLITLLHSPFCNRLFIVVSVRNTAERLFLGKTQIGETIVTEPWKIWK